MERWISYLENHRYLNLLIILIYYLLVVLPHEEVGKFIAKSFSKMERDDYNFIILLCTLLGLVFYLIPIVRNIVSKRPSSKTAAFLFLNIVLAIICFKILFVVNVEAIHFIQYGFLALLVFPLVRSYWKTAFWCMILGALDEAWQYFYLAPLRTDYYDFNDVIINTVGAGFGLIFVSSFKVQTEINTSFLKSKEFYFSLILLIIAGLLYRSGHLMRKPLEGFWQVVHPEVTYHVVYPLEGIVISGLLILLYSQLNMDITGQNKLDPS